MDVLNEFLNRLPLKRRSGPSGWISFCAPCCHKRGLGHKPDKKMRGGLKVLSSMGFAYSCFNCSFKAVWQPGRSLSKNAKLLLKYLGASEEEISSINFNALKTKYSENKNQTTDSGPAEIKPFLLPKDAMPLNYWLNQTPNSDFLNVVQYLVDRNPELLTWYNYYWSPDTSNSMNKRIIVPFFCEYDKNKFYGYSARSVTKNVLPKYIAQYSNGYLFGQEHLFSPHRKYAILCEGIFDAISLSCTAIMKQTISKEQLRTIKLCEKEIIVVPDRDNSGKELVLQALDENYSVSLPDWDSNIKDIADAVTKYGRLATFQKIIQASETSVLKTKLKMNSWFK